MLDQTLSRLVYCVKVESWKVLHLHGKYILFKERQVELFILFYMHISAMGIAASSGKVKFVGIRIQFWVYNECTEQLH